MLATIRRHLAASAPHDAARAEHHEPPPGAEPPAAPGAAAAAVDPAVSLTERFRQALEAVGGHCAVVRDEEAAAQVVQGIIAGQRARRVAVSDAPLARRVVEQVRTEAELLTDIDARALFDCDIGITGAQWAAAETGTLVLESDRERHRLASLVPPVHVALIAAAQVRPTLGEVLHVLGAQGAAGLSRAVTFITGPSRTSDIELTLAIGVHGPGALHVIIIEG
jgi:L-lactate dehydrogenase complex protein LldG